MADMGFAAAGTIQEHRPKYPLLKPKIEIVEKAKGCMEVVTREDNICQVKWCDNNVVTFASIFIVQSTTKIIKRRRKRSTNNNIQQLK